jgi:hypothetical protein
VPAGGGRRQSSRRTDSRPAQRATRGSNVAVFTPNLRTGYVHEYSFSLQWEPARNTIAEAAFVGQRGVKLFMQVNVNQCPPGVCAYRARNAPCSSIFLGIAEQRYWPEQRFDGILSGGEVHNQGKHCSRAGG